MINCSKGVIVSTNGSDIIARENKKHYDFTGQELCEVNVNWQAKIKDAQGKETEVDCSVTFLVNEDGIKEIVGNPTFGGIINKQEVLELVKQNKEVFINGKSLHDAITKKEENEQAVQFSSSGSPAFTPFSAFDHGSSKGIEFEGYGTRPKNSSFSVSLKQRLLSRRNSLETSTVEHKTEQLIKSVTELELEVDRLKQENEWLTKNKKMVEEERDEYMLGLEEAEENVAKLKLELNGKDEASKKRINELLEKQGQAFEENGREIKEIIQEIEGLEENIKRISNLTTKLGEEENKIQQLQAVLDEVLENGKERAIKVAKNGCVEELSDYALDWERDFQHAVRNNVMLLISGFLKDQENGLETQKIIEEALDALSSTDVYTEAKVLSIEEDLQAEQKKSSNLERNLQAKKAKILNLEKGFQDEKAKVFNLEKKLQDEQAKLSDLTKDLKSEEQKVANLKKRNSINISKAKRALSTAALLIGLVCLFSQVQSIELCYMLCVVFLISLVYCIYNICTMSKEHDYHSHDLSISVSGVDSMELEDCECVQQNQIQAVTVA